MTTATTSAAELLDRIRAGPHWRVLIHPAEYQAERIPTLDECWRIVERTRFARFGWEYPVVGMEEERSQGGNWIAFWRDFNGKSQYWRLYQSGQFVLLSTFREDRQDDWNAITAEYQKRSHPLQHPTRSTGYLSFREAIRQITAIFEFASRLLVAGALDGAPVVRIEMKQIKNRHLVFYGYLPGFTDPREYHAHEEDLGREWRLAPGDDPVERAREAARWFFEGFGYCASETELKLAQEDFLNNRWR